MLRAAKILAVVVLAAAAGQASADGMIVPVHPRIRVRGEWAVKYHHVSITVRDQVASVSIDQEFVNTGRGVMEVEYLFPVPPGAAIDAMTLLVDGKEFKAQLLKADEARRIYEDIVRRKKDPALLEYVGFGLLKTSAFPLEPGKPARVVVNYKDTCRKEGDTVEVWYPLNTEKFSAKPIEHVEVKADIKSSSAVLAPYSPTHDIHVAQKGPGHVIVTYSERNVLPATDFQVFYKETDKDVGVTLLTHQPESARDGYFLMLVSPNPQASAGKVAPKDMVIVLDRSGSMSGPKLAQAKEALAFILNNLNKDDRFNVIAYSDLVEPFFEGLVQANQAAVKEALDRLDRVDAAGGTNIHEVLEAAMKMAGERAGEGAARPAYVIFLTDGLPTVGKRNENDIVESTRKANERGAKLFAFGVGYDVNAHLLDRLAADNKGRSDYVKPKEPVEAKVSSLYRKIKNPVMTGVKVRIEGLKLRDVYPRDVGDLFEGDQLVLAGRYEPAEKGGFDTQLVITGTYEGRERGFEYPVTIRPPGRSGYEFVEKLWAIRRVGYLLDEIQLHGKTQELVDELVRLSSDYGIMTPYTSFLADEGTLLADSRRLRISAGNALETFSEATGGKGQTDAMNRQAYRMAEGVPAASAPWESSSGVIGFSDVIGYEQGRVETVANVRQIGNQALYRRDRAWVTAEAARVQETGAKAKEIQRFSDEYFALVRANTVAENQLLAGQQEGEELVVLLRGQLYSIR